MSTVTRRNDPTKNKSTYTLHAAGIARRVPKSPELSRRITVDKSECSPTHSRATFRAETKTKLAAALNIPKTLRKCQNGAPYTWSTCRQATITLIGKKIKEKHRTSNATKITALKRILHLMMLALYKQLTTAERNHIYPVIGSVRESGTWFVAGCLQLIAVIGSF